MRHITLFLVMLPILLTGCGGNGGDTPEEIEGLTYTDFFSAIPEQPIYPMSNPYSREKEALGELLFWDPILSGDMDVACASCHHPDHNWADGRVLSIGVNGSGLGPARTGDSSTSFHAPTVLNVAFTGIENTVVTENFISGGYFWDLRADTLEEQSLGPIKNEIEMRGNVFSEDEILPEVIRRLNDNTEYVALFAAAFPESDPISDKNIASALATFQRKLITGRTRFDDFLAGDELALNGNEIEGLNTFINSGCVNCHFGPMLSDFSIHQDQPVLRGLQAVRTPGLRNVADTAPYMHNGSRVTLAEAIAEYEERNDLDVTMNEGDIDGIEAFLQTLSNNEFYSDIPVEVPSGLSVGGNIVN